MRLVVHIPKTAGTSLRWALEGRFGKARVIRDYGPHADETSKVVREYLYDGSGSQRPAQLVEALARDSAKVLMGHFRLSKYMQFFQAPNIIAFVRDPLVRICSEYLHRLNKGTYAESFSEFVQKPGIQNLQSTMLDGISEDSFIGITEQYNASLRYLDKICQLKLATLKKNIGRNNGGQNLAAKLSAEEKALFYAFNLEDETLYRLARQRFMAIGKRTQADFSVTHN